MSALQLALLSPSFRPESTPFEDGIVAELANALVARGHRPRVITSHPGRTTRTVEDGVEVVRNWRPPGGRLVRRGYLDNLTHAPLSYLSLLRGEDRLAHALHPADAAAALRWKERTGNPFVFQYMGVPDHADLMERRLKLELTERAARGADAVVAESDAAADAFRRWLGVEALVIPPGAGADGFVDLYGELLR